MPCLSRLCLDDRPLSLLILLLLFRMEPAGWHNGKPITYCFLLLMGDNGASVFEPFGISGENEMLWRKSVLVTQLVAASAGIAKKAGEVIRSKAGQDLKVVQKGYKDFQTEADRASQTCIIGNLRRRFGKELRIIGEEDQDHGDIALADDQITDETDVDVLKRCGNQMDDDLGNASIRDVVIWVDPLDGTSEFTEGLFDHVTVLIGVAVRGKAVGGIVHQPFYGYNDPKLTRGQWGRTIWGMQNVGAFGLTPSKPPQDRRIIATTRSHSNKIVNAAIEATQPDQVLRVGGAGYKVVLVIEGVAHAYVFASGGSKKWDTCAPEAVLTALGGKLTDIAGNPLRYHNGVQHPNSAGVLATPPGVDHNWYVERIPKEVKEALPPVIA